METSQVLTLNRLLQRLDHTLLSPEADSKLRYSHYERNRVGANIEHARNLLLTLEKQSATARTHIAQKQQIQTDLQRKRELVKKLNARLQELGELDEAEEDSESDEDDEENADLRTTSYAPARADADGGLDAGSEPPPLTSKQPPPPQPQSQPEMRSRKPLSAADNRNAASTTAREDLFAGRKQHPDLETTEALMSHNRSEQDALTNGLLGLARALKESTVNFGTSLEQEKEVMKRAEGSLEKSSTGMEAASKRMGALRRMSEGQGWWGRVKLYGCIFALWVFLFLVVFVGPKLRF